MMGYPVRRAEVVASGGNPETPNPSAEDGHSDAGTQPRLSGRLRPRSPRRYLLAIAGVVVAVVLVASVVILAIEPVPEPPVDVYSKPTPPEGTELLSIFPTSILGCLRTDVKCQNSSNLNITTCHYGEEIVVEVANFSWAASASSTLSTGHEFYKSIGYNVTYSESEDEHWYTFTATGVSGFSWQKDIWVFWVQGPDGEARDAAASALPY